MPVFLLIFQLEADAIVKFDSLKIFLNKDCTGKMIIHKRIKMLSPFGVKVHSEKTFWYITLYDTVRVLSAKVIHKDGNVTTVPPDNIKDMPMPAWKGSRFLIPNFRSVKIIFPTLSQEDEIDFAVEYVMKVPPKEGHYSTFTLFEGEDPIMEKVMILKAPKSLKFNYKVEGDLNISFEKQEEGNNFKYKWYAKDIPQIVKEPLMPPIPDVATKVIVSNAKDWKEISRWYYNVCEKRLKCGKELKQKVKELIENAKSFEDTVRSLYEFVNKEIRYVETRLTGRYGGFVPEYPDSVYYRKYGVCRDKAGLLCAMLREAGIKKAFMVLTNPVMRISHDIADISRFNHAICAIVREDTIIYLDPTIESSVEFLSPIEADKDVLICTPYGDTMRKTPSVPPEANLNYVETKITLSRDNVAKMYFKMWGKGSTDMGLRAMLKFLSKEQIKQLFEQSFSTAHPSARIDSIRFGNPDDFSKPMTLEIFATLPDYATIIGDEWHLGGGRVSVKFSPSQFSPFALEKRKYPVYFTVKMASKSIIETEIPENLKIFFVPRDTVLENDYIKVARQIKIEDNKIIQKSFFCFKKSLIPPEDYPACKEFYDKMEKAFEGEIILKEK